MPLWWHGGMVALYHGSPKKQKDPPSSRTEGLRGATLVDSAAGPQPSTLPTLRYNGLTRGCLSALRSSRTPVRQPDSPATFGPAHVGRGSHPVTPSLWRRHGVSIVPPHTRSAYSSGSTSCSIGRIIPLCSLLSTLNLRARGDSSAQIRDDTRELGPQLRIEGQLRNHSLCVAEPLARVREIDQPLVGLPAHR